MIAGLTPEYNEGDYITHLNKQSFADQLAAKHPEALALELEMLATHAGESVWVVLRQKARGGLGSTVEDSDCVIVTHVGDYALPPIDQGVYGPLPITPAPPELHNWFDELAAEQPS